MSEKPVYKKKDFISRESDKLTWKKAAGRPQGSSFLASAAIISDNVAFLEERVSGPPWKKLGLLQVGRGTAQAAHRRMQAHARWTARAAAQSAAAVALLTRSI